MGGFMIDGCGVADSFYPISDVGTFYCNCCRKEQPFKLMEVKMKIRVFFVPTVPIKTKWAIACHKCKTGFYIEEYMKDDILAGKTKVDVTSEGVHLTEDVKFADNPDANNRYFEIQTEQPDTSEKADDIHRPEVADSHTQDTINTLKKMALEQVFDENNNSGSTTVSDITDDTDSEDTVRDPSDENSSPDSNIHTTGPDFSINEIDLPRIIRKQCPTCGMFFREDTDSCPICCCELIVKEYKMGKE